MIYCAIVLFRLVLFRRFTEQARLGGSNKIVIDLMSLNFIDSVVIQIKDIIDSNRFSYWRQINISYAEISLIQLNFFSRSREHSQNYFIILKHSQYNQENRESVESCL